MPETARSKPLEIWFQDEARVGQQGTLTRIWAERGTRPRAPRDTRYIWSYIFGAVCPERAEAAALIMPHADTQAMSAHLAEIAKTVASGAHALLILDGAGWHGSAELKVPDNITLLKLPPYSPELNPMENVWAYLRANKLAISVFDNYEQIVDRCCEAWNFFANDKTAITSITTRQWAKTVNARAVGIIWYINRSTQNVLDRDFAAASVIWFSFATNVASNVDAVDQDRDDEYECHWHQPIGHQRPLGDQISPAIQPEKQPDP